MENCFKGVRSALAGALILTMTIVAADAPAPFKVSEFTFTPPAGWEVMPAGGMRKAQLKIKGEKGATGEVVFFEFPAGQGGTVTANVNRWLMQFKEPREQIQARIDTQTKDGRTVTYVAGQGTYLSGMPGGPKTELPNHALRGAIVESDKGNVFARMVLPVEMVKAAEPEFKKMIEGALKK